MEFDYLPIDKKDQRILNELDKNGKEIISNIAKKVNLSIPSVKQRIINLQEKNILLGFVLILNTEKLGYSFFNTYYKTQFTSLEEETEIIEYLKNHPNVGWFASFNGTWNFKIGLIVKNRLHYEKINTEILNKFGRNIIDTKSTQPLKAYVCKHKFLSDEQQINDSKYEIADKEDIDKLDFDILKILDEKPRTTLLEISDKTKNPVNTIKYRIKKLTDNGIIQEYKPIINFHKFHYTWYHVAFRLINFNETEKNKLINYLRRHNEVFYILDLIGAYNVMAEFLVKDTSELKKIIQELKEKFKEIILTYDILTIEKEYKHTYLPKDMF
jgi:DNA-binding Lrp family transcriptional regulator